MHTPSSSVRHSLRACAAALACLLATPTTLHAADDVAPPMSEGFRFGEKDGESLYRAVCQSCHMPDGQGAKGAGMYPALAANPRLAAADYVSYNVLHGRKGMPPFKHMLSDAQIAEVSNYVRTHMGNDYRDAVTAADVKALR